MHPIDRAKERYGVSFTRVDIANIRERCLSGKASLLQTRDHGLIFGLIYNGVTIVPVLKKDNNALVTFLPTDAFNRSSRQKAKKVTHGKCGKPANSLRKRVLDRRAARQAEVEAE